MRRDAHGVAGLLERVVEQMSEFKPGDMVECVDDSSILSGKWIGTPPVAGHRYTIRAVHEGRGLSTTHPHYGLPHIDLAEIQNRGGYRASRFRLIKPPATDIQIFRDIVREVFEGANA